MNQQKLNEKIGKKLENKIAISNFKKEENNKMSKNKIAKMVATFVISVGVMMGVAYAGTVIYEKVWKEPKRVALSSKTEITPEMIDKNITEEEAREIAKNKLKEIGLGTEEIVGTDHMEDITTEAISYRFLTNHQWSITIDGKTGEFYDLWNIQKYDKEWEQYTLTKEEAIKVAKEWYQKLGYQEGAYKLVRLMPQSQGGEEEKPGYKFDAKFYKQYDDLYNRYESVSITFYAKDNRLENYRVENKKFENNPLEITKEKAIEIAINEDRKVESKEIISTETELRIEKMNGNAYARLNHTEEYYKPMTTINVPPEEQVYYQTENRIRRVWVVSFSYGEEPETDVVTRYAKGTYAYFVDATTGEIIGGDPSDYIKWDNYWGEKYAVV